jgi:8-oxo-dGTP pyrophosphatase MutT (NUDIX family)
MIEQNDVYNGDKNLTGRTHPRGKPRADGDFVLIVHVLVQNSSGLFLITKRSEKDWLPNLWENTGGAVIAGETSLDAAIREFHEETGFTLDPNCGELLFTEKRVLPGWSCFLDNWLFRQDFDTDEFVPQEGETVAARWAAANEIIALHERGEFVPFGESCLEGYFERLGLL